MKIRNGFVSNSSSSSFIVIGDSIPAKLPNIIDLRTYDAETNFGWQEQRYEYFGSKLMWALIIGAYGYSNQEEEDSFDANLLYIQEVLLSYGIVLVGTHLLKQQVEDGYIDHQSIESENAEMWESKDAMARWLLSNDSYIQCDNDNH